MVFASTQGGTLTLVQEQRKSAFKKTGMICLSVTNRAAALTTPLAVSVCIDVQVKGMPMRASWSGTDGMEQALWYRRHRIC